MLQGGRLLMVLAIGLVVLSVYLLVRSQNLYGDILYRLPSQMTASGLARADWETPGRGAEGGLCRGQTPPSTDWKSPSLPDRLHNASQDDPDLVRHICDEWLLAPFTGGRRLNNPELTHYSQRNQSEIIDDLLQQKTNGFFVECGAADGETLSNSLFFEKTRNWTGLLVEGNPKSFRSILEKRRHAYMINACLSPKTRPMVVSFQMAGLIGGLTEYMVESHKERIQNTSGSVDSIQVQCFPLYSILKAVGVVHVDYFSLDIEGAELEVLYSLPFDQLTVDVFSIEYYLTNNSEGTAAKLEAIKHYLVDVHGYEVVHIEGEDIILRRK